MSEHEDFKQIAKNFNDAIQDEIARQLEERQKKYDTAWAKVAFTISAAGEAKGRLAVARKRGSGDEVFEAAQDFRAKEAGMNAAVEEAVNLIASESQIQL